MSVEDAKDARRVHGLRFPLRGGRGRPGRRPPRRLRPASSARGAEDRAHSILARAAGLERDLAAVACQAAVEGPESLPAGIPVEAVGKWSSVDRSEIEGMRAVRNIMAGYVARLPARRASRAPALHRRLRPARRRQVVRRQADRQGPAARQARRPVDLQPVAVPLRGGAAAGLPPGPRPGAAAGAAARLLGRVRHAARRGNASGGCATSLRPCRTASSARPARSTRSGRPSSSSPAARAPRFNEFAEMRDEEAEKAAKKPDFLSRLKGYVNVFGPNPVGPDDVAFMLRRALLLRGMLRARRRSCSRRGSSRSTRVCCAPSSGSIVTGTAHGPWKRSSTPAPLAAGCCYERSSLPPEDQLELQVDARAFLGLMGGA